MNRAATCNANLSIGLILLSAVGLVVLTSGAKFGHVTSLENKATAIPPAASSILSCDEPVFDFGRIQGHGDLEVFFPIVNICNQAAIVKVVQSCACMPRTDSFLIQPGETYHLPVRIKLAHVQGALTRSIRLKTLALVPPAPRPVTWPFRIADDLCRTVIRKLSRPWAVLHQ